MSQVKFIQRDGATTMIVIEAGCSVMLGAVRNGVDGIDGECGGCLDCATCHVYVDEMQFGELPPPQQDEFELLSTVAAVQRPNSRLSCQLKPPFPADTLVVYIPEKQS